IAFNPDGTVQLCYPEGGDGKGAPAARPDAADEVRYPRDKKVFVLDSAGLQAFVLAASTKPLPAYDEWRSPGEDHPWAAVREGGAWRWHFDGREFTRYPRDRGRVEPREGAPEPMRKLCEFFKGRAEFDAVQVIAFPVTDAPK